MKTIMMSALVSVSSGAQVFERLECEHDTLTMKCPVGEEINVLSASYGRTHGKEVCPHRHTSNQKCHAASSVSIVKAQCQGKDACKVEAKNNIFGDPCGGTFKYLTAKYECVRSAYAATSDKATLKNKGNKNFRSGSLKMCEGDCDKDSHCKGNLKCFQREKGEKVPGCAHGNAPKNYDFCYDPEAKTLQNVGNKNFRSGSLKVCQGDCDKDSHCAGDLKCFQREKGEKVPGCANIGGSSSNAPKNYDFCYDPAESKMAQLTGTLVTDRQGKQQYNPYRANRGHLEVCEGDCDKDSHCKGNLKCFQREKGEKVPGCAQGKDAPKNYDYCYDPGTVSENEHTVSCEFNCNDWSCATWCRCFNEQDAAAYEQDGCIDDGPNECSCE